MPTEFTAILLAGGRSTRMGRDKAMLDWRGRPLIEHMVERLRRAGAMVRVSGDRPGYAGIPDATAGLGPVGGIVSVVPHCADGAVLVVPVDMPLLSDARITRLREGLEQGPAAHFVGHPLPCGFRLDAGVRARLAGPAHAAPARSMRDLLAMLDARGLPVGEGDDLRPCNTPSDFAALAP